MSYSPQAAAAYILQTRARIESSESDLRFRVRLELLRPAPHGFLQWRAAHAQIETGGGLLTLFMLIGGLNTNGGVPDNKTIVFLLLFIINITITTTTKYIPYTLPTCIITSGTTTTAAPNLLPIWTVLFPSADSPNALYCLLALH